MTKLPDCPQCQEAELWLHRDEDSYTVACYYCGWRCYILRSNLMVLPRGVDIESAIFATVAAARAPADESGVGES